MKLSSKHCGLTIIGASGAGKTTLVRLLKRACVNEEICFPVRLTTRELRADDQQDEQESLTVDAFRFLADNGDLWLWWTKSVPGGSDCDYGFRKPRLQRTVLSGNSDLLLHPERIRPTSKLLERFRSVLVTCESSARHARLLARDPGLAEREAEYRKRSEDDTEALLPYADFVVDTTFGVPRSVVEKLRQHLVELA